jgi:glucan biosynthesis protein C
LHGLKGQILVLAISSYVVLLLVRATGMAYVSPLGLTSPYRLATYAPYFAAGILMYRSPRARAVFLQAPPALLLVSVPLALISELHEPDYGRLLYEATEFLSMLGSWMSVAAVLSLFRRIFSAESPLTRFLSEASYSIYLFHHVIVIALGIALIPVSLPLPVKFLAICAVTFLATVSMHVLIVRRLPVVRFLFNGKR